MTTVLDRLRSDRPVFFVEFSPPRSDDEEDLLWRAIRQLEALDPAFVSVTYGAGGSSRDRTIRMTARIAAETTLLPVAHLTGVELSITELRNVVGWYATHDVRNVLVIRGDPPGDPQGEWIPHPEGLPTPANSCRSCRRSARSVWGSPPSRPVTRAIGRPAVRH